ncbi:hypothetical protein ASG67_13245 [Sphingomonas sp. Leaf339]|uniref:acyltransferase family protein n=1 Tax=Sphingomonas sp. Leaf339 TaxID=1736343 RepID=UPI0006F915CB|nr:acyltransferase [Sphingomonas sp. Leaf339]KQU48272.1 hypothetical protein ASG67_13245 [Sphingomonas sp. Leaf339]
MGRRFLTLDAVRGVAALAVFCLHAGALIAPIRVPHAFLAVDLFFLLSGFVIDHAYAAKLAGGLSVGRFVLARYIRLYPLYLVGLAIGVMGAAISLAVGQGVLDGRGFATVLAAGLLMLPSPTADQDMMLAPFNYPAWSLMFEMAINIVFALTFRWLTLPVLLAAAAVAGAGLCGVAYVQGSIDFGANWGLPWVGFLRVTWSFAIGVAMHRLYRGEHRFTPMAWLLPLLVIVPFLGFGGVGGELLIVLIVFPAFVWLAVRVEPMGGTGERVFVLLGTVSYPLYVIHLPTVQVVERAFTVLHIDRSAMAPWVGIVIAAILAAAALLLDRWYDRPVRGWLSQKLGF